MALKPETLITISELDKEVAAQVKKTERRKRKDPELFAMLAVSRTVNLAASASKQLGRRMALHIDLISDPTIFRRYSSETKADIEKFSGWATEDLKRRRGDLSNLPQVWSLALHSVVNQYGNPES